MAENECLFSDTMVIDIHDYLRQKETTLPDYIGQSPQLSHRRCRGETSYLVDWLAVVSEKVAICELSRHLAVELLDFFMDRFSIVEPQLKLVAIGCLLIACKLEEQEIHIPKSVTLNQFVPAPGYTARDFISIELTILQHLGWRVQLPTAAHFTGLYTCCAVSDSDIHMGRALGEQAPTARQFLNKYVQYFLEVSLQDSLYRHERPSRVACACIASSRLCLSITPTWTHILQRKTGYSWSDIGQLVNAMLFTHKQDSQRPPGENGQVIQPTTPPHGQIDGQIASPECIDQGYHSMTQTPATPAEGSTLAPASYQSKIRASSSLASTAPGAPLYSASLGQPLSPRMYLTAANPSRSTVGAC